MLIPAWFYVRNAIKYSRACTLVPGIQPFLRFLPHFVLAKTATNSIRVNEMRHRLIKVVIYFGQGLGIT